MTWMVLRSTGQVFFCSVSHSLDLSDVYLLFLMIRFGLYVLVGEDPRGKCPFHHITSKVHSVSMAYSIDLDLVGFSFESFSLIPLSISISLEGSHYVQE